MNFTSLVWTWIAVAIGSFIYLLFRPAPYGRYATKGWGPLLSNRVAWIIMETPVFLIMLGYLIWNFNSLQPASSTLMGMFLLHYFNRCFIYPFRIKNTRSKMPLTIVLSAVFFNLVNGNVLGYYFTQVSQNHFDWKWVTGIILFFTGMIINVLSDETLIRLKNGSDQYFIPQGALYNYISCPNYFGEILEWLGFAVAGGHIALWSFFIWTCANLIPRALSNHKWYHERFSQYPRERKAVIPFVL